MTAAKTAPNVYSGQLIRTTGPAFNAVPFDPAMVTRTVVGHGDLHVRERQRGDVRVHAGRRDAGPRRSRRHLFVPPAGTVCGEPYRTPAPVTIVAAGDIAQCGDAPAAASAAARTAALVAPQDALVLTLGDNAYDNGTPAEFANCFHPTWGAFKDRIRPSPGNHEYDTAGAEGYFGYFGAQAGPDRRGYYSFDYGGWHFISLNSVVDVSAESAAVPLARRGPRAVERQPVHDRLLALSRVQLGRELRQHRGDAAGLRRAAAAGVEMVLSGHEHVYERFAPQRADGTADPARGVRQFVVGTGGDALYPFGRADSQQRVPLQRELGRPAADARPGQLQLASSCRSAAATRSTPAPGFAIREARDRRRRLATDVVQAISDASPIA